MLEFPPLGGEHAGGMHTACFNCLFLALTLVCCLFIPSYIICMLPCRLSNSLSKGELVGGMPHPNFAAAHKSRPLWTGPIIPAGELQLCA